MGRGARLAVAVPALALLAAFSAWLVPVGQADWLFQPVRSELRGWVAAGSAPTARAWEGAREKLESAIALSPSNPALHRHLALLHLTPPSLALSAQLAAKHAASEVSLRPSAPDAWTYLVQGWLRAGLTQPPFERVLVETWRLGPSETGVHAALAMAGLPRWDALKPQARSAVRQAIAAGMGFRPEEMLRRSQASGRLFPACAHVQGDPRLAQSSWLKACAAARGAGSGSSQGRQE